MGHCDVRRSPPRRRRRVQGRVARAAATGLDHPRQRQLPARAEPVARQRARAAVPRLSRCVQNWQCRMPAEPRGTQFLCRSQSRLAQRAGLGVEERGVYTCAVSGGDHNKHHRDACVDRCCASSVLRPPATGSTPPAGWLWLLSWRRRAAAFHDDSNEVHTPMQRSRAQAITHPPPLFFAVDRAKSL
jgi:hypothetical protein